MSPSFSYIEASVSVSSFFALATISINEGLSISFIETYRPMAVDITTSSWLFFPSMLPVVLSSFLS